MISIIRLRRGMMRITYLVLLILGDVEGQVILRIAKTPVFPGAVRVALAGGVDHHWQRKNLIHHPNGVQKKPLENAPYRDDSVQVQMMRKVIKNRKLKSEKIKYHL